MQPAKFAQKETNMAGGNELVSTNVMIDTNAASGTNVVAGTNAIAASTNAHAAVEMGQMNISSGPGSLAICRWWPVRLSGEMDGRFPGSRMAPDDGWRNARGNEKN